MQNEEHIAPLNRTKSPAAIQVFCFMGRVGSGQGVSGSVMAVDSWFSMWAPWSGFGKTR